ncbi:MAG: hypothetical protein C7B46_20965 [Sulfobacillus benefaciens]|uniref:Uncharacterized protein n=1 Tax=Sulfobacillus benefaciens TaxID=453960 RepID=A0A2T2WR12_9FIRM|nr:MAG: hypothetical protein C7B46_20965 [Sulfobacillus benefaciens]
MIRLSLEEILETAKHHEVEVEMTPSETPFVIETSTGLLHLPPLDMIQIVGDYSANEIITLEYERDRVWGADLTILNSIAKKVRASYALYTVSDLPAVV